jgi:hypothetical protein
MVGLVQIMEHHSLAHAQLDILVMPAQPKVNAIFTKVLHIVFFLSHFYSRRDIAELSFIS